MKLDGRLEKIGTTLIGWALDHDAIDQPVEIDVQVNGAAIVVTANEPRKDLETTFGSGRHGFAFDITLFLKPGQNEIRVVFHETGTNLPGGQAEVDFAETTSKAFVGLGGWLFLQNDSNNVVDQMTLGIKPDAHKNLILSQQLYVRELVAKDLQLQQLYVVAPEKYVIYSDKVTPGAFLSSKRPVFNFNAICKNALGEEPIYPASELLECRRTGEEVYFKTDTHTNSQGALVIAKAIARRLGLDAEAIRPRLSEHEVSILGDLADKTPDRFRETTMRYENSFLTKLSADMDERFHFRLSRTGSHVHYRNSSPISDLTAVIFGTSTTFFQSQVYASLFRETLFLWTYDWDIEMLKSLRPSVVLNIIAERYMPEKFEDFGNLSSRRPEDLVSRIAGSWPS